MGGKKVLWECLVLCCCLGHVARKKSENFFKARLGLVKCVYGTELILDYPLGFCNF